MDPLNREAVNRELLERARAAMPGGVSSPVRAFHAVGGEPRVIARGSGAEIVDVEGRSYVDLVGSWGPLVLGNAHPAVVEAVQRAVHEGQSFGATCEAEIELAERALARFPMMEKLRFVSSGTEAVMSAVRLARGATGRKRIVKFAGCYHGHADGLLVEAGSGLATFGRPSSAGVPEEIARLTDVLPLDDERALARLFEERGHEIAAVLIEPLPANAGLLIQRRSFLVLLRELCTRFGALLVFDEVISGFRVAPGGMTELLGLAPDLLTLGKILGGGFPVGAYLGPADLMEVLAPNGPVYQAGTLSGNPMAMAAGLATLRELERPGTYERLESLGARLERAWSEALSENGSAVTGTVVRQGSILWLCLQSGRPPRAPHRIERGVAERFAKIHPAMLEEGVWMPPSAYEVIFLSMAHREEHLERAGLALRRSLERVAASVS